MKKRALGRSGIQIAPLVFGGNVFGWTVDEARAPALLDRFIDGGLNAIDTADVYSRWVPGNRGGESETIIGKWLKRSPARRSQVVLITKVGSDMPGRGKGLSRAHILAPRSRPRSLACKRITSTSISPIGRTRRRRSRKRYVPSRRC